MVEPHWTAYVQAFGTPFVALVAGGIASLIAYRQWQTAKAKVVLDLFEKRLEVYNLVWGSTMDIIIHGAENIDHRITQPFVQGLIKSKFVFGPEIYIYLDEIWKSINRLQSTVSRRSDSISEQQLERSFRTEDQLMPKITKFHDTFDEMVFPYMRMEAKLAEPNAAGRWLSRLLPRRFRQGRKP